MRVLAPATLIALINHMTGKAALPAPTPAGPGNEGAILDMADVKGQETARRAIEVAAAGGHNMLMIGPPGAGKSMLAARLPGVLPPMDPAEALEVSMIHSVAGLIEEGRIPRRRPYLDPHYNASMAAMVGGGRNAAPGQISLAHNGVLFLDELPEFARPVLESLRQPMETGEALIARANAHVRYPARFQLVTAMNPCRCGHLADPSMACSRAPNCGLDYQARISGPLLDRLDVQIEIPGVTPKDLSGAPKGEPSASVAARVARAREAQRMRFEELGLKTRTNAALHGDALETTAAPDAEGRALLDKAAEALRLTGRGYHRVMRLSRTIADLDGATAVAKRHVAEAVSYRRAPLKR